MKTDNSFYNIENYFADQKNFCGTFFERAARNGKKAVFAKFGKEPGQQLLDRARDEYTSLLPQVPYVGEVDILKRQMLLTVIFSAFYRVLKDQEKIEDIWELCEGFNRETLMGMPKLVRWILKRSTFSKGMINSFRNLAQEHRDSNLADQWEFVEGDGETFEYGMNMTKCAKVIFLRKIGAEAFAPYVCLIDKNFANCCNYGLKRTQVIAEGAEYCDFRLSINGQVDVKSAVA